jgi:hypothetical protein
MALRAFALLMGIVFGLVGVLGFTPGAVHSMPMDSPPLVVDEGYGLLLGLFPVNVLHNLVHVAFGALGLAAYAGLMWPLNYARLVAVSYGALTLMGLVPGLNTVFGLVPIYGADVILHVAIAAVSAYFGFFYRVPVAAAR